MNRDNIVYTGINLGAMTIIATAIIMVIMAILNRLNEESDEDNSGRNTANVGSSESK